MKAERPSRAAHFVALGRAVADAGLSHIPDFHDPTARVFLSEQGRRRASHDTTQRRAVSGIDTLEALARLATGKSLGLQ